MSPLRQYEAAKRALLTAHLALGLAYSAGSGLGGMMLRAVAHEAHIEAHRLHRAAVTRLVLSALGYLLTALLVVGVVYVLVMLLWAGFAPEPEPTPDFTDTQLPTV